MSRAFNVMIFACVFFVFVEHSNATVMNEELVTIGSRPGVEEQMLINEPEGKPKGIVLLYPSHEGVVHFIKNGDSYRVESEGGGLTAHEQARRILTKNGYVAAILGLPTDEQSGIGTNFRFGEAHTIDSKAAISYLRNRYGEDVFLHGHCRSTFSPAAVATRLHNEGIRGIILSSTRSRGKEGAVTDLDSGAITVPVLLVGHVKDPCPGTPYSDLSSVKAFYEKSSSKVDIISVKGGKGARNSGAGKCSGGHHAFSGQQKDVMNAIVKWLNHEPIPAWVSD